MTDPMEKFEELLTAYGNANFDCGDFGQPIDGAGNERYRELATKAELARKELCDFVRSLVERAK